MRNRREGPLGVHICLVGLTGIRIVKSHLVTLSRMYLYDQECLFYVCAKFMLIFPPSSLAVPVGISTIKADRK